MTKLTFGAHPHLLGFEQLKRLVERTAKTASEGYPPFNIEAVSENAYRITLAVAGFPRRGSGDHRRGPPAGGARPSGRG